MIRHLFLSLTLALMVAACAPQDRLLLLPGEHGVKTGAVAVLSKTGATVTVVDKAYTDARISGESFEASKTDAEAVRRDHGALIDGLPKPPTSYILYFKEGTTTLTPTSEPILKALFKDAAERAGADVQVTGHTDTLGSTRSNDELSLRRAKTIREMLVKRGLAAHLVRAVGRGERELLTQTKDRVRNAENRRVEITVR
jgi:outer membrane protein OmpA-like peptidoglycan-associated protein